MLPSPTPEPAPALDVERLIGDLLDRADVDAGCASQREQLSRESP